MAVKNTCQPPRIYGPVDQTLFLGCSVVNFSANAGWNEQQSELTVQLVQDTCGVPAGGNPKVYYDSTLTRRTTTAADPGFYFLGDGISPPLGAPVYFRFGDFEFCGILNNWKEVKSASANPAYDVTIVDPRFILEGTQLIIGDYAGSVYNLYNTLNVFGAMESFGEYCPERAVSSDPTQPADNTDTVFGSPAQGFGGADVNDNGMPWNLIRQGIGLLTSAFPKLTSNFSPYGRLVHKGASAGGYGLIRYDSINNTIPLNYGNPSYGPTVSYHDGYLAEYMLDISEVPTAPTYWRITGPFVSIMEVISQICLDAGMDFFVELIPVRNGSSRIDKVIKVRTVSRAVQPRLGFISDFIGDSSGLVSSAKGRELRTEPTQALLIGGKRKTIWQAFKNDFGTEDRLDDMILPYFGLDNELIAEDVDLAGVIPRIALVPILDENTGLFGFNLTTQTLNNLGLKTPLTADGPFQITPLETSLLNGGFENWWAYHYLSQSTLFLALQSVWGEEVTRASTVNMNVFMTVVQNNGGKLFGRDIILNKGNFGIQSNIAFIDDIQLIYNFLSESLTENYGTRFMVRVPYICHRTDSESFKIVTSEKPTDAGYTTDEQVLFLNNPDHLSPLTSDDGRPYAFKQPDGRIGCFAAFGIRVDDDVNSPWDLNANKYFDFYVPAEIEPEFVYCPDSQEDIGHYDRYTPRAVIKIDKEYIAPLYQNGLGLTQYCLGFQRLIEAIQKGGAADAAAQANIQQQLKNFGNTTNYFAASFYTFTPDAVAVPLESTIHTYGPWYLPGPPGSVRIDEDEGLVPWEYGGMDVMDLAGNIRTQENVTYMQAAEMGSVTVVGYPSIPLGAELGASFNSGGSHLIENRFLSTNGYTATPANGNETNYNFMTVDTGYTLEGIYGPNITSINVRVGEGGMETSYEMRTFSQVFGRFSKKNAERLKKIGQERIKFMKLQKLVGGSGSGNAAVDFYNRNNGAFTKPKKRNVTQKGKSATIQSPSTASEVLVGQTIDWRDGKRSAVGVYPFAEIGHEIATGYTEKAVMSLDALLRPVSIEGTYNFPRFGNPEASNDYADHINDLQQYHITYPSFGPIVGLRTATRDNSDGERTYHIGLPPKSGEQPFIHPRSKLLDEYSDSTGVGHDIDIVAKGSTVGESGIIGPIAGYNSSDESEYADDYRFFALKGPLVMQAWGYDTEGKPIPNVGDLEEDASGGNFTKPIYTDEGVGLHDRFLSGWLKKSHTWPVGPVDLRYDRRRGVWCAPPPPRFVECWATGEGAVDETKNFLIETDNDQLFHADGSPIKNYNDGDIEDRAYISVKLDEAVASGEKITAYFDPVDGVHKILRKVTGGIYQRILFTLSKNLTDAGTGEYNNHFTVTKGFDGVSYPTDAYITTVHPQTLNNVRHQSLGIKGLADYDSTNNRYVITSSNEPLFLDGELVSALHANDYSVEVDNISGTNGGAEKYLNLSSVYARNLYGWEASLGSKVTLKRRNVDTYPSLPGSSDSPAFDIIQVECIR